MWEVEFCQSKKGCLIKLHHNPNFCLALVSIGKTHEKTIAWDGSHKTCGLDIFHWDSNVNKFLHFAHCNVTNGLRDIVDRDSATDMKVTNAHDGLEYRR